MHCLLQAHWTWRGRMQSHGTVKEDQQIKKGQKIAEMGNTGADQVKLHFEIRRQGKPVDPLKYLPPRK